jgi:hypothetical protein
MIRSTGNPVGTLILSKGKPHYSLYWNFTLFLFIPLTIYISSKWGIIGISWGWVFLMLILMVPNWYFLVRPLCGANFGEYFKQIIIPFLCNIIILSLSILIKKILYINGVYFVFVFSPLALIFFILYNWLFNKEFITLIMEFFGPLSRRMSL